MSAPSRSITTLRLVGEWPWWLGLGIALLLAAAVWPLYGREVRAHLSPLRYLLPALRSLAVFLIVAMLAGPVLHHRETVGQLARLLLFVDGSQSMGIKDLSMDPGRKLRILQQLGQLGDASVAMELPLAGEALAEARTIAGRVAAADGRENPGWDRLFSDFATRIQEARDQVAKSGDPERRADKISSEILAPARELVRRESGQIADRQRAGSDLARLAERAAREQDELSRLFKRSIEDGTNSQGGTIRSALQRFDAMSRAQRLQGFLLEGGVRSLLEKLGQTNDVELFALEEGKAIRLWHSGNGERAASPTLPLPTGLGTNLATGLKTTAAAGNTADERGAIVLFSDGQHNEGESPQAVARILAGRQWPIYSVGFGGAKPPPDLAVVKITGPETLFFEDRLRGEITLKDEMPPGLGFRLAVRDGAKTLWEQELRTEGRGVRRVTFDFPIGEAVRSRLQGQREGVKLAGVPLELTAAISMVQGDSEQGNNEGTLRIRALTQKRKVLLLDGRPRWETRYLRNLFDRDEQWEMNAVIANVAAGEPGFRRGSEPGCFPTEPVQLQTYDLIIFGDIPRSLWKVGELESIRDFVGKRGGALIFVDGARGSLREYGEGPLGSLLPVEWKTPPIREHITRLMLPERGQALGAFSLVPESTANAELWQSLKAPHWLSGASALPGSETLVAAEIAEGAGTHVPAVVLRPFGAGRVLYQAFEDSWRWRYEVADEYHVKYWNQVGSWLAEIPFAVRDRFVALDAGAITYRPGDSADLRVRLSDSSGKPVTDSVVDAVLFREGERVATIRLTADENAGGLFRGRTAALESGSYEVGLESAAIPDRDSRARTSFKVQGRETGELTQLSLNEELLRQIAAEGGGQYLREEALPRLPELLAPLSQGRIIESDTLLWQSYWWFVPIILLLTVEWLLRKRLGLV